jgi:hypothetical protein
LHHWFTEGEERESGTEIHLKKELLKTSQISQKTELQTQEAEQLQIEQSQRATQEASLKTAVLKASRGKGKASVFLIGARKVRRTEPSTPPVLGEKSHHLRVLCQKKMSFRDKGEIDTLSVSQS